MKLNFTKILCLLACLASSVFGANAAIGTPFRAHVLDSHRVLPVNKNSIVFIGCSLVQMTEWKEFFGNDPRIVKRGVSGCLIAENIEELESTLAGHPAKIFIQAANNDGVTTTANHATITARFKTLIQRIQAESPSTEIYVMAITPSKVTSSVTAYETLNALIKAETEALGATYVDVYTPLRERMNDSTKASIQADNYHFNAEGIKIICDVLAPYVGINCSVPADYTMNDAGFNTNANVYSIGMRATHWSVSPVTTNDVLFIGDAMVHAGEWSELLNYPGIKNRGTAWAYQGMALTDWATMIPAILAPENNKQAPRMILLNVGLNEAVAASSSYETNKATYKTNLLALIAKIREYAPATGTKIVFCSQIPLPTEAANVQVQNINALFQEIAGEETNVEYADIYTPLCNAGTNVANSTYVNSSKFVTGKGYVAIAQVLAPIVGDGAVALDLEAANLRYDMFTVRTNLANAIAKKDLFVVGTGLGQYPASALASFGSHADNALAFLRAESTDITAGNALITPLNNAVNEAVQNINQPTGWNSAANSNRLVTMRDLRSNRYVTDADGILMPNTAVTSSGQWKLMSRGDGTFDIVSSQTGAYITPEKASTNQFLTSMQAPATGWGFSYSSTPGTYIITNGTAQFNMTNSTSATQGVINWGGGSNRTDAGCTYYLEESDELPKEGLILSYKNIVTNNSMFKVPDADAARVFNAGPNTTIVVDVTDPDVPTSLRDVLVAVSDSTSTDAQSHHWAWTAKSGQMALCMINKTTKGEGIYSRGSFGATRQKVVLVINGTAGTFNFYECTSSQTSPTNTSCTIAPSNAWFSTLTETPGVNALTIGGTFHPVSTYKTNRTTATFHSVRFYNKALSAAEVAALKWDENTMLEVEEVEVAQRPQSNLIYDIYGRVYNEGDQLAPGIYIRNGKKFIVR